MKLTLAQAATRWGWSRSQFYRVAVQERRIPGVQIGSRWYFDSEELDRWWAARSAEHVTQPIAETPAPTATASREDERAALGLAGTPMF